MKRPEGGAARAHRDYLREVMRRTGEPFTRIAKKIGVAPSTLSRILEDEGQPRTMHANTLAKLAEYSGVPLPQVGPEAGRIPRATRGDAVLFDPQHDNPDLAAAVRALIGQRKNIQAWALTSRSLETLGYMPGDVVLVDLAAGLEAGTAVCADLRERGSDSAVTLMRLYRPPILMPATLDPGLMQPYFVDNDRIIVRGAILPHRLRASARA